jgi:hypothetical protein
MSRFHSSNSTCCQALQAVRVPREGQSRLRSMFGPEELDYFADVIKYASHSGLYTVDVEDACDMLRAAIERPIPDMFRPLANLMLDLVDSNEFHMMVSKYAEAHTLAMQLTGAFQVHRESTMRMRASQSSCSLTDGMTDKLLVTDARLLELQMYGGDALAGWRCLVTVHEEQGRHGTRPAARAAHSKRVGARRRHHRRGCLHSDEDATSLGLARRDWSVAVELEPRPLIRLSSAAPLSPELAADKVTHNPHDPKNQPCFQTASPRDPVPPFPPMHARIAPDRNSASTLPATRRRGRCQNGARTSMGARKLYGTVATWWLAIREAHSLTHPPAL